MFLNYFITARRIFARQKTYALINVLGLAIGLAAAFVIFLYIRDELSYDRSFTDSEKVFRIGISERFEGHEINYTINSSPLADALRTEVPEVVAATRIGRWPDQLVTYEDKSFIEPRFLLADKDFFKIFDYHFIEGNPLECLNGPDKIVITESTAKKYFGYTGKGDTRPIGKHINFERTFPVEVTGIVEDVPHNTHLKFDMILSLDSWSQVAKNDCWACYGVSTYVKLDKQSSIAAVEKKLRYYIDNKVIPRIETDLHVSKQQMQANGDRVRFFVQPLPTIHLESHTEFEFEPNGDIRYVKLFGAIALFVILIACSNFMNLATARAVSRGKEVGVRKTLGALRGKLIQQFLFESVLYAGISAMVAGVIVLGVIEPFNTLTGKQLAFPSVSLLWVIVALFVVLVGLLAGIYPSFYLTSFRPIEVLKKKIQNPKGFNIRNVLVVFQFVISVSLVISTLLIYKQLKLIQKLHLGFDRENVLRIPQAQFLEKNAQAFRTELLSHPEFASASFALRLPPHVTNDFFIQAEGNSQLFSCFHNSVDPYHLETMGLQMKAGRFFTPGSVADSLCVVINESCAKMLGYSNFEGKNVVIGGEKRPLIGVVRDFNFQNARQEIRPLVLFLNRSRSEMAVRLTKGNISDKIKLAESIWKKYVPESPFQYSFVDEDFNSMFGEERQMGKVFLIFTGLAIFIACLGLLGLVTFMSTQRVREIGVRKVFGATKVQIMFLLSGSLVRLVLISFAVAIPLTWYVTSQWLQSFAYRTTFDFGTVFLACTAGIVIVVVSVARVSYAAASNNPVDSLKSE